MKNLRAGLIRIAKAIGHWLVRRLGRWLKKTVLAYLDHRIADFRERKKPNKRRINRWVRAREWLASRLDELNAVATHEYDALASELEAKGVPEAV